VTSLILLHPVGLDGRAGQWLTVPTFLAPDLPGHGVNSALTIRSLDEIADFVASGMTEPADVIGALLGGAVGMHLALRHPQLVRSLVLAGTDSRLDAQRLTLRADAVLDGSFGPDDVLTGWFGDNLDDPRLKPQLDYTRERLHSILPQNYSAAWRALAAHDVDARLDELTMPVTVIAASGDNVHGSDSQSALARRLRRARVAPIDAHHMSILDAPDAFSSAVNEHLSWARSLKN
jgi:3-oxoadipate enol-lactonase